MGLQTRCWQHCMKYTLNLIFIYKVQIFSLFFYKKILGTYYLFKHAKILCLSKYIFTTGYISIDVAITKPLNFTGYISSLPLQNHVTSLFDFLQEKQKNVFHFICGFLSPFSKYCQGLLMNKIDIVLLRRTVRFMSHQNNVCTRKKNVISPNTRFCPMCF